MNINKILAWFGLIKISRAETISARIHIFYVTCVLNGIQADFGRKPDPQAELKSEKWWRDEFRQTLKNNADDINIITEPVFKNITT